MKLEVESYDYQKAIDEVDYLLGKITFKDGDLLNVPSAAEIVDMVIDKIL